MLENVRRGGLYGENMQAHHMVPARKQRHLLLLTPLGRGHADLATFNRGSKLSLRRRNPLVM